MIHARLQPEQAARTYAQGDAAERAYEGRQAEEAVRSRPAEAMIIDEGDAGRKKASQEAVESSVMELAAYGAETVIRIVAPLAVAVQITQGKGVLDGFYVITEAPDFTGLGTRALPEIAHAHAKAHEAGHKDQRKEAEHEPVRHDMVERTRAGNGREERLGPLDDQRPGDKDQRAEQGHQEHIETVGLEEPPQELRPGKFLPRLLPELCHDHGVVQVEFVRRGILAGIIAAAAVVAEIGKVLQFLIRKLAAQFHNGEDSAETFTVSAGIADGRAALRFFHYFRHTAS